MASLPDKPDNLDTLDTPPPPKPLSLFRLVTDQARIDDHVMTHPYPGAGTHSNPFVISWIPEDAGNPVNWRAGVKWTACLIVAVECFVTAFASSAFSGTMRELIHGFHTSTELMTAGISLFVLGFAVGPLIWAPLSEIFGRQIVFVATYGVFTAFNAGCTSPNSVATLLVLRFFAGSFGSSPFTNGGGVIADVFNASERGLAMALFALAPSMGPCFGPFIAGFLGESEGWRWVMGLMTILSGVVWVAGSMLVPETYAPVLLKRRAQKMSQITGRVYKTKLEVERADVTPKAIVITAMVRPWVLLFHEPIVILLSIYMAIIYGTLYLLFGAFPIVFQVQRGWSEGVGGLAFLGVAVGMILAILFSKFTTAWYLKSAASHGGIAPPESRMPGAMIGAVAIPIGMFWFAWTNGPDIHWISPVMAGAPFGFGMTLVFLGITSYLIDAYTIFAASVLAANTVLRSLFGAAFPLFTQQMYQNLGIHWASSIPGFLALACVPFPFVLYKYGAAIREKCVYAAQSEAAMAELTRAKVVAPPDDSASSGSSSEEEGDISTKLDSDTTGVAEPTSFEPLKAVKSRARETSNPLQRVKSRTGSIAEAAAYDASPYDIDRVNTSASVKGLERVWTRQSRAGDMV